VRAFICARITGAVAALPYESTIERGSQMSEQELARALPREVPDYHERQAAHYKALAETATTPAIKARLLREAEEHDQIVAVRPAE